MVTKSILAVLATLIVVEFINGIVMVSKLKIVETAFEVIPAVKRLVVVTAFAEYKLANIPVRAESTTTVPAT
jgi:hypothetical protein